MSRVLNRTWCGALLVATSAACASPDPGPSLEERGQALFYSGALSRSKLNHYTCATCHDVAKAGSLRKPGATMAGATLRKTFWAGQQNDLLAAVNDCRSYFMVDNDPLQASDPAASELYAYLLSLEPGKSKPVPFSVVTRIEPIERGDATRGEETYAIACAYCHGSAHSGAGRLGASVPVLPEDTNLEHAQLSLRLQRIVFVEKVRHGAFLSYGGDMPPFSTETLSDAELADVLEYLAVYGE